MSFTLLASLEKKKSNEFIPLLTHVERGLIELFLFFLGKNTEKVTQKTLFPILKIVVYISISIVSFI